MTAIRWELLYVYRCYSLIKIVNETIFSIRIDGVQDCSGALKDECFRGDKNDYF